jgi:hypothetical protein
MNTQFLTHSIAAISILVSATAARSETINMSWNAANQWITDVRELSHIEATTPSTVDGWQRAKTDVMDAMAIFTHVEVRPGYVLRAYVRNDGSNALATVVGLPESAGFPEANPTMIQSDGSLRVPGALSIEQTIKSDGTAEGYFQTSLLARELRDFGARWHGTIWSIHTLLTQTTWPGILTSGEGIDTDGAKVDLFANPDSFKPSNEPTQWKWYVQTAGDSLFFAPAVSLNAGGGAVVRFYTHKVVNGEAFTQFIDTFDSRGYLSASTAVLIAQGPAVVMF